jgi:hypothetical protein
LLNLHLVEFNGTVPREYLERVDGALALALDLPDPG